MNAASALALEDLTVGYRIRGKPARAVLSNLRARAVAGELTVLLGPNGTGKSTLLRTICGLQAPLGGQVLVDGAQLSALPWVERAKRIAVLLTDRIDPGLLSAAELVGLGRHPHTGMSGRLTDHDRQVIAWALDAVDATALAGRRVAELSDGERQRVLTARALAQNPGVVLMDEPTAFLDMPSRVALTALLHTLARERELAVVMSTHDLELALRVADAVWLIDRHGALRTGSPEELTVSGAIADTFNGENLHFDAAGGVFVLRHTAIGTVRIDAGQPDRALVGRALARQGWREVDTGPSDLEVTAVDGRYDLRMNGRRTAHPDIPALARHSHPAAGQVQDRLRCADPSTLVADLSAAGRYGPNFGLRVGDPPADGPAWSPVHDLYGPDSEALRTLVDGVTRRLGASEPRVAASVLFLGYAARLWSIVLAGAATGSRLIDLPPRELHWRSGSGEPIELWLPVLHGWEAGDDATLTDLVHRTIITDHLAPLLRAVRTIVPLAPALLWGNAASALAGTARVMHANPGTDPAARTGLLLARRLLAREPLLGAGTLTHDWSTATPSPGCAASATRSP